MTTLHATNPPPPRLPEPPTVCLLHGDFHVMAQECWAVTVDFYVDHQHLEQMDARDAYQAAVERKMLDDIARSQCVVLTV